MKKILIVCLLIFDSIYASMMYEDTIEKSQTYINSFQDYKIYLINSTNIPYKYENKMLSVDSRFTSNGFLNLDEFLMSKNIKGNSYLFNGFEYFTMSERDESVYLINNSKNNYELKPKTINSNIRTTYYVKDYINVNGIGTYNNPWVFIKPEFKIELNLTKVKINDSYYINEIINTNEVSYELVPDENTVIDGKILCDGIFDDYEITDSKLSFKGIKSDISCTLKYKPDTFTANLIINNATTENIKPVISALTSHTFSVVPNTNYSYTNSYCDNDQRISANGHNFTINNISSDTTCYINYLDKDFPYSKDTVEYIVDVSGDYYLEVYGAQGGNNGGKGGYAKGKVYLEKGDILYVNTGGTDGTNGGGAKSGSTSYAGGGASTIKRNNIFLIIGAGGGATGKNGTVGGAGGSGNGAGGASVGSGAGKAGTNGGGGSSSPTYSKTCTGSCKTCSTCKYSYTGTCTKDVCASTACNTCSYTGTCTTTDCSRGYRDENGNWICWSKTYSCTKTDSNCSKCGSYCKTYKPESYSCSKTTTAANCDKCGCDVYNTYDCSILGKPGTGGSNSFGTGVSSITNSSGVKTGNGSAKITFVN